MLANNEDLLKKYTILLDVVKKVRAAQKDYYASGRDKQKLFIAKNYEKKLDEILNPTAPSQATIDWLAQ
jgi:hypothetical protein